MSSFRQPLPLLLAGILFGYLLLLSFASGHPELSYDEACWSYIGQHWLQGELLPYVDAVDNKPAGILFFYGLSVRFFGVSPLVPRIIGSLSLALAGLLLFRLGCLLHSRYAGYLAFLLYALANSWTAAGWRFTAQAESLLTLLSVAAFLWLFQSYAAGEARRLRRVALASACLGLAMCFKQSAALSGAAFLICLLMMESAAPRPQQRSVFVAAAGMLVLPSLCLIAALAAVGVSPDLYLRSLLLPPDSHILLAGKTSGFFATRVELFQTQFLPRSSRLILPFAAALAAGWSRQTFRGVSLRKLLAVWIVCDFLILPVGGNYATYQLRSWLPALAAGGGIGLAQLLQQPVARRWQQRGFALLIALLLLNGLEWHPDLLHPPAPAAGHQSGTDRQQRELGLWIKQHTGPADPVYVAGFGAVIQAYAERCSPTRYFAGGIVIPVEEILRELNRQPPLLLLIPAYPEYLRWTPAELRQMLGTFVQTGYRNSGQRCGYTIFIREAGGGTGHFNSDGIPELPCSY